MSDWTPFEVNVVRRVAEPPRLRWWARLLRRRQPEPPPETMTWEYRRVGNMVETRHVPENPRPLQPGEILIEGTYEATAPGEATK